MVECNFLCYVFRDENMLFFDEMIWRCLLYTRPRRWARFYSCSPTWNNSK